jgi:hypothetical protein
VLVSLVSPFVFFLASFWSGCQDGRHV